MIRSWVSVLLLGVTVSSLSMAAQNIEYGLNIDGKYINEKFLDECDQTDYYGNCTKSHPGSVFAGLRAQGEVNFKIVNLNEGDAAKIRSVLSVPTSDIDLYVGNDRLQFLVELANVAYQNVAGHGQVVWAQGGGIRYSEKKDSVRITLRAIAGYQAEGVGYSIASPHSGAELNTTPVGGLVKLDVELSVKDFLRVYADYRGSYTSTTSNNGVVDTQGYTVSVPEEHVKFSNYQQSVGLRLNVKFTDYFGVFAGLRYGQYQTTENYDLAAFTAEGKKSTVTNSANNGTTTDQVTEPNGDVVTTTTTSSSTSTQTRLSTRSFTGAGYSIQKKGMNSETKFELGMQIDF